MLLHQGQESFYGAGERGYSLNLAGDTLINYNAQNYGYQMGEKRTQQMGITMPMVISSRGYGILFDDFCKSSLYLGNQGIEYTSATPQPISY
jgi:alpha-glucosidase (family GH31 glycosyl hydrolase)